MHRRDVLALSGASLTGCVGRPDDDSAGADAAETAQTADRAANRTLATDGGTDRTAESLTLSSSAFDAGATLPTRFSCDGEGVSPPLSVAGVPDDTAALAVVADDPDAPGSEPFVHWLLWNLPADTAEIPADVPGEGTVLGGARQGTNGGGDVGYYPACPPAGDGPHTYRFTLFALGDRLDVTAGARRDAVQRATDDATLERARLTATYERS
ncbi:hypothetical protein SAMN04487947_1414 [Halogeometricum rufum]|uniref:Phospholipid-binding protein, PBP family n=1 Tax=Halogeometricum rufum TaxID=553469 RepID=A0A1I6GMZ4_9EURY|nr:YbhB/YbcL family Raf kinase inhibitor-like protein [Halogeometricum rufum]SFR43595.1 hypothetical protein SAMN04487947_1414 [Halogeometricum rufum]